MTPKTKKLGKLADDLSRSYQKIEQLQEEQASMIRQWRERYGLSQSELARRAGYAPAFINFLEQGKRKASTETMQRIAAAIEEKEQEEIKRSIDVVKRAGIVRLPDAKDRVRLDGTLSGVAKAFGRLSSLKEASARGKDLLRKVAELPPDYLEHPLIKELIAYYQRELDEKDQEKDQLIEQLKMKQPARVAKK